MQSIALTLAALIAAPQSADGYGAIKTRLDASVNVAGIFLSDAQYAFDANNTKEGCRQLRLARKELINAGEMLNQLSAMPEADSSESERSMINGAIRDAQNALGSQNATLNDRCQNYPEE